MWLLIVNSLKGIAKKKLQMIGLIFLILVSAAVYTTMNSTLDRMDGMSEQYLQEQQVEHMTILLNETRALTREDYGTLYNAELQSQWQEIVTTMQPIDETTYNQVLTESPQTIAALDAVIRPLVEASVPEWMPDRQTVVDTQVTNFIKQRLAYLLYLFGIIDGTHPANEVNAYLFYGCMANAKNPLVTNTDPTLPWMSFCPSNRSEPEPNPDEEPQDGGSNLDELFGDSSGSTNVARLQTIMEQMSVDPKYNGDKYAILNLTMDDLAATHDFKYSLQTTKILDFAVGDDPKNYSFAVKVFDENATVNIPYLIAGRFPTATNEITVSDRFAQSNRLALQDQFEVEGVFYTVVGFAYAPDYIYPAISFNTPLYDRKRHSVVFTTQDTFDLMVGQVSKTYSARFLNYDGPPDSDELSQLTREVQRDSRVIFVLSTATISPRLSTFTMEIKNNRLFTSYFMYVLLAIAIFIIIMIMKKRIEDERLQIGVLKSLGYKTTSIAAGYLVYPVVGAVIGASLGYLLGLALQTPLIDLYKSFYNIPMDEFSMNPRYFINSLGTSLLVLVTLSYVVALYMLRHRPLQLLREGSNLKINRLTRFLAKILKPLSFKKRFKYSLASRSLGKLITITLCSFSTGLLIVLTLIGATMMNDFVEKSFAGSRYEYRVTFASIQDPTIIPDYAYDHSEEDVVLGYSMSLMGVENAQGVHREFSNRRQVSLNGIDETLQLLQVNNEKGVDLTPALYQDDGIKRIIINDTVRILYDLKVGDTLFLARRVNTGSGENYSQEISFLIAGINDSFSGLTSYVARQDLTDYLGFSNQAYNTVYTNTTQYDVMDPKISNIFRMEDLKQNIRMAIEMTNISLYIIIAFAGLMALVIISVVSNIVVDENRKHISLMKVMGYQDKEISSVILNIYTPFVVIAYLLSIPAMIGILRFIVRLLARELDFSLPIGIRLGSALLGLGVILGAYFIALFLSRRALNKVSLAEALKRE